MRISTYEIILPLLDENEKEIPDYVSFVNGLYGAIDIVEKKYAEKIKATEFNEIPPVLRERLALRGHLTRKSEAEEIADMKLLSRIHRKTIGRTDIGIKIMPTYDCNFRCPYCYEQHRLKNGQAWLEHNMSDEIIEAVFSALDNYKARGYSIGIFTFYGGEPFLKKNLPVVRKIAERCRDSNIKMDAITNGYDLDAFLDLLSEFDFTQLQVTIDGVGEINNRRRIHKDGGDTYERILANVELALERGIGIDLRVNVGSENLHGIKDLIEDLEARGFIGKEKIRAEEEKRLRETDSNAKTSRGKFHYYFKATDNEGHPERNVSEQSIIDELVKAGMGVEETFNHQSQYYFPYARLKGLFQKKFFAGFDPAFCGSETGMFIIDPFGRLYSCLDFVDKAEMEVGFVDVKSGRFFTNFDLAKWHTRTADLLEKCQACPYCFTCRGGCAGRAQSNYGSWCREYCGENKEIFDFIAARLIGKHWQEIHEEEMSLSLAGPLSRLSQKEREIFMTSNSQKEIFELAKETGIFPGEFKGEKK